MQTEGKAGVCDLKFEAEAESRMRTWMASWKDDPGNPGLSQSKPDGKELERMEWLKFFCRDGNKEQSARASQWQGQAGDGAGNHGSRAAGAPLACPGEQSEAELEPDRRRAED